MATMNISLPDTLRDWVETQVQDKNFSNNSDFVREMLRRAKEQSEYDAWLTAEINRGLLGKTHSGTVDEMFAKARARTKKKLRALKTK